MRKAHFFKLFPRVVALAAVLFASVVRPVFAAIPNDPFYAKAWYLDAIGMPSAWDFAKGSPTVRVAVIDSGVDISHPDLSGRIWTNPGEIPGDGLDNDRNGYADDVHGWDFVDDDPDPNPDLANPSLQEGIQHGTLVAGIIGAAGNNGEGVTGVNWNVEIMPLRVLDSEGSGGTVAAENAIRYAIMQKARVINISFIGPAYSSSLAEILRAAHQAGIVIVAAAGNEGDTERGGNLNVYPEYPVCYKGAAGEPIIIGVSSLDRTGQRSSFSNYGSACVGVSAPGEGIFTTQVFRPALKDFQEPYGDGWAGSSLSAPIVSGVAALMLSLDPSLTPDRVRALIQANAVNVDAVNGGFAGQLGAGRIDAAATLMAVQKALLEGASGPVALPPTLPPSTLGTLVKSPISPAVYYLGADGRRYVFPNQKTYATWFPDFRSVRTITTAELAAIPIGGNVTYRPGTRLLKLQTGREVYAVSPGGVLRHVASEAAAVALFGSAWGKRVDDLPEAFFTNYRVGTPITSTADYDPAAARDAAPTIDADRALRYTGATR